MHIFLRTIKLTGGFGAQRKSRPVQRFVELSRCAAGGKKKKGQAWGSMG